MRALQLAVLFSSSAFLLACSDGKCHPDEVKVGTVCLERDKDPADAEVSDSGDNRTSMPTGENKSDASQQDSAPATDAARAVSPQADAGDEVHTARSDIADDAGASADAAAAAVVPDASTKGADAEVGIDAATAQPAVDAAIACVPTQERCDGFDNDCDGQIDEPIDVRETPIGESCSNGGRNACAVMEHSRSRRRSRPLLT